MLSSELSKKGKAILKKIEDTETIEALHNGTVTSPDLEGLTEREVGYLMNAYNMQIAKLNMAKL